MRARLLSSMVGLLFAGTSLGCMPDRLEKTELDLRDAWVPAMSRGIENADHFHLLLFETRGKLVPATLPRTVAELDPALTGRMYGPETAWFRVTVPEGSAVPRLVALPTE